MDALITAAARALASGDPIGALNRVALRDDAPALALRGIAMAQLGDFARARALVRSAALAFGPRAPVARARCTVAEAEIALAARDLDRSDAPIAAARRVLEQHGDRVNAAHAQHLQVRRLVLLGRLDEASLALADMAPEASSWPHALVAVHALVEAGIAMHRLQSARAHDVLARADHAARASGIAALMAEVRRAAAQLDAPAGRALERGETRLLGLADVEALLSSDALVVDGCRYRVRGAGLDVSLNRRPVLFTLARALAAAWPGDATRTSLIADAFRMRKPDDTHRARLRVEIGRLRALLVDIATIDATTDGFTLKPTSARRVVILDRSIDEPHAVVLALLADGASWSSSSLALALGTSQRTVQRALDALAEASKAQSIGHGRARRWITPPMPAFATALLLHAVLPGD